MSSSALLDLPGAVDGTGVDAGVAWHYGDPMREQRALAESVGFVDRGNRGVLLVPGEDRGAWLHSLTTQHLEHLAAGTATEALVLSPTGRVEHHAQLADVDGVTWLDLEPGDAGPLLGYLDSMRFWSKVDPADASADYSVLSVVGPETARALSAIGVGTPAAGTAIALPGGGIVRGMAWPGPAAADVIVPRGSAGDIVTALTGAGVVPAGLWAFEALRVEARRPRLGFETDHRTIPHEVGWIGTAVHLDKGCYRGQETVARVHNLGKPPRRLVLLHLDGSSEMLPGHGTPVESGGRAVGFVGTAVHHHDLGPIALALVKRQVPDDADLSVGSLVAAIDR